MSEEKHADGTLTQGEGQNEKNVATTIVDQSIKSATNKLELEKGNNTPIGSPSSDDDSDYSSPRSDLNDEKEYAQEYGVPVKIRTIDKGDIRCKDIVIGPDGFVSIGSIIGIVDHTNQVTIYNKDEDGNGDETPYKLDTLTKQLNITASDATDGSKGGSKRSRKAKRTKKGGKKRRNTLRRHRKSR
jgi:hypothetical protein